MTDNQEDKKAKKLTLGGSKLSLGNYPKKVTKTLGGSGSIVVEVKRGKATGGGLTLSKGHNLATNTDQESRRLAALQRSKADVAEDQQMRIGSLSKLAEINQGPEAKEEIDVAAPIDEVVVIEKAPNSRKEHTKKSSIGAPGIEQKEKVEEEKVVPAKPKILEPKRLKKSDIIHMLEEDSGSAPFKTRSLASIKRARAKEKRKSEGNVKADKVYREVILPEVITVAELSNRMSERASDVTRELMKMGVMATSTQSIDADTAELVATTLGHSVKRIKESDIEDVLISKNDAPEDLKPRAPIVTVMGHVDHGKTSLLDALKSTDIVGGEAGGITQHIGAYTVTISDNRMITFIDTPGHEAFTEMRTRGAQATDIVVLVVAADDGIKAQTVEAISHAKAAGVPIIVAINKIDKPEADIDRVKTELLSYELVPEDLGGDIITVGVSAKQKKNLDKLEEAILLVAEMQELKANPDAIASGVVVESKVDQSRGVIATVIVQRGTLKKGDLIIAGNAYGRVRTLCNDKGQTINEAGPSVAVEVYGLNDAPSAGDIFNVAETDKQARDIVEYRQRKARDLQVTASKTSLEDLFLKASGGNKIKELPLIIKGDVHGSIEAIITSLGKIESDEVKLKVLHSAVGGITESDITLATASGALILGFNVRANNAATSLAENNKVDIRYYSIIYNLIDDIKAIMSGMLSPIIREVYIGSVVIREVFNISKVGKIAGSYVTKGMIKRGAGVRLLRDSIVIHEGKLKTLKRFKDDVKEVKEGYECGIAFENYDDIKVDDSVEVFEIVEEQKKL
ncbi:MAG: translation initiation factor IF-2 [Rickettsiaceae bacterium]|nr:translation initiation factor IF-2 [Rickettsiaceae bacterium]